MVRLLSALRDLTLLLAKVVLEALSGESSQAEVCRRHNLSEDQLSKWKHQLVENAASLFNPRDEVSQNAAACIAHLEQLVWIDTLDIGFRRNQVWVGDITYVRLS